MCLPLSNMDPQTFLPATPATSTLIPLRSRFETEMPVRPDDIDMNQHVHNSRYFDYVLAARYDQMARCYRMPTSSTSARSAWAT